MNNVEEFKKRLAKDKQEADKRKALGWMVACGIGLILLIIVFSGGSSKTPTPTQSKPNPAKTETATPTPAVENNPALLNEIKNLEKDIFDITVDALEGFCAFDLARMEAATDRIPALTARVEGVAAEYQVAKNKSPELEHAFKSLQAQAIATASFGEDIAAQPNPALSPLC